LETSRFLIAIPITAVSAFFSSNPPSRSTFSIATFSLLWRQLIATSNVVEPPLSIATFALPYRQLEAFMIPMSSYVANFALPTKSLSEAEQSALLTVTGQRRGAFRDHMIFSFALGTGLREHELVALDVGDVVDEAGRVRRRICLRTFKRASKQPAAQEVLLSESLRVKARKFIDWKRRSGQSVEPTAPLFVGRSTTRLSTRQVRHMFRVWQQRAGFDKLYTFHALRHTGCTAIYRSTKDILITQSFARHKDIRTTMRYAHPDEADLLRAIQGLRC